MTEGAAALKPRLRPRWAKVLADLWGNKARSALVVASIAVGVFAIGVIVGAYAMLSEDLGASYAFSNAANITVLTSPFDEGLVAAIERMQEVSEAEGVRELTVRVRLGGASAGGVSESWDSLLLVAHPEFDEGTPRVPGINRRYHAGGALAPDDREVVLEHQTLDALGLQIGDALTVELPSGTRRELAVVGAAVDQSDLYDTVLGGLRGYISLATTPWLQTTPSLTKLLVTVEDDGNDKVHIRQVAQAVTDRLEETGHPVYRTEIAGSDDHPFGGIIQALLWVLIIVGVMIVLLSGSLITNTMAALLAQHLRQIGVMKLVGARRAQVIGGYLLLISSFGIIALVFAVPPAGLGAYGLARLASGIINFKLRPFEYVPAAIAVQVAVGLLIPPLAGLAPVLKGSRVTVRKALSSTGISEQGARVSMLDRVMGRIKAVSRPTLISLRNTFRRKMRLALTLLTLTLGGAVFIGVFSTQDALDQITEDLTRYFGADVALDFSQPYRMAEVMRDLDRIPGVVATEAWITTGAGIVRRDQGPADAIGLIAAPADSHFIVPKLIAGRWLVAGDETAITVNEAIWQDYPNLDVGDPLMLEIDGRETSWTVVGIFQYTGSGGLVAYANHAYVAQLLDMPYHATTYRILTDKHSLRYQQAVASDISETLGSLGYRLLSVEPGKELTTSIPSLLGIITKILLAMALMTALVGSIGLAGTMGMNVMERTREIGVMRAIGAHNGIVLKLVIVEGLVIGLISYLLGAALSVPIGAALSNVISIAIFGVPAELVVAVPGFAIWLGLVSVLSVFASLLPALRASKLTIREVLAYE